MGEEDITGPEKRNSNFMAGTGFRSYPRWKSGKALTTDYMENTDFSKNHPSAPLGAICGGFKRAFWGRKCVKV
jgi:hypothetical protein